MTNLSPAASPPAKKRQPTDVMLAVVTSLLFAPVVGLYGLLIQVYYDRISPHHVPAEYGLVYALGLLAGAVLIAAVALVILMPLFIYLSKHHKFIVRLSLVLIPISVAHLIWVIVDILNGPK